MNKFSFNRNFRVLSPLALPGPPLWDLKGQRPCNRSSVAIGLTGIWASGQPGATSMWTGPGMAQDPPREAQPGVEVFRNAVERLVQDGRVEGCALTPSCESIKITTNC